jgi:hypothetical protein
MTGLINLEIDNLLTSIEIIKSTKANKYSTIIYLDCKPIELNFMSKSPATSGRINNNEKRPEKNINFRFVEECSRNLKQRRLRQTIQIAILHGADCVSLMPNKP